MTQSNETAVATRRRRRPRTLQSNPSLRPTTAQNLVLFVTVMMILMSSAETTYTTTNSRLLRDLRIRRGGASSTDDNSIKLPKTESGIWKAAESDNPSEMDDGNNNNNQLLSPLSIRSLFRLHNEIKAHTDDFDVSSSSSPSHKGRGGALATRAMPEVKPNNKLLFGVFDTSKDTQSSSSSEETSSTAEESDVNTLNRKPENNKVDSTSKLSTWWNNAWQSNTAKEDMTTDKADTSVNTTKMPIEEDENLPHSIYSSTREVNSDTDDEEAIDELDQIMEDTKKEAHREEREKSTQHATREPDKLKQRLDRNGEAPDSDKDDEGGVFPIPEETKSETKIILPPPTAKPAQKTAIYQPKSPYESSGYWSTIDSILSAGYSSSNPNLRISRRLRVVRKQVASVTGMHGLLSGKHRNPEQRQNVEEDEEQQHMGLIRRRLAAIERARNRLREAEHNNTRRRKRWGFLGGRNASKAESTSDIEKMLLMERLRIEEAEAKLRYQRVQEIDTLIAEGQERLVQLVTEKDILQKRPNPLWNYTTSIEDLDLTHRTIGDNATTMSLDAPSREFKFPPPDLVDEYLTMLLTSGRLAKLNHTDLWRNAADEAEDDDDDDLLSPRKEVIEMSSTLDGRRRKRSINGGSGSRWLRNGLGEKLGETVETAAYRAVAGGVMSFLARLLSSIHGINVMHHTDIRLFAEQSPNLPPSAGFIPGADSGASYAHGAFETILRKSGRKPKKRRKRRDDSFIQRDAVVETLISQCQIAAPLLKIFPIAWQRAMLGNIVTLITCTMTDFFEGLEFEILGHRLSFNFVPITENDMLRHWASEANDVFTRRHKNAARFEAAVEATAADVAESLKFLDKWHERVLGGDALKTQLSHLVARLVLTLVDETLSGARMDLWTTHAGGPRLMAGLEYRTEPVKAGDGASKYASMEQTEQLT